MTNLSAKTARSLKEAGFPQSAPAVGQWWYESDGELIFILRVWDEYATFYRFIGYDVDTEKEMFARLAYCPTDAEMLAALGNKYRVEMSGTEFSVWRKTGIPFMSSGVTAPVLSEALAAAWLQSKEK